MDVSQSPKQKVQQGLFNETSASSFLEFYRIWTLNNKGSPRRSLPSLQGSCLHRYFSLLPSMPSPEAITIQTTCLASSTPPPELRTGNPTLTVPDLKSDSSEDAPTLEGIIWILVSVLSINEQSRQNPKYNYVEL